VPAQEVWGFDVNETAGVAWGISFESRDAVYCIQVRVASTGVPRAGLSDVGVPHLPQGPRVRVVRSDGSTAREMSAGGGEIVAFHAVGDSALAIDAGGTACWCAAAPALPSCCFRQTG
jgi:hypothetical protein